MKSLDTGPSAIVPIKFPDEEKQSAINVCKKNETLSSLIREATKKEVTKRTKTKQRKTKK